MEILVAVWTLGIVALAAPGPVCSVSGGEESELPIQCPPALDSDSIFKFTTEILGTSGLKKPEQGESMICRIDEVEVKDKEGQVVQFMKAEAVLPGASQTQIIQRTGESQTRVHIVTDDRKLIRFDPVTKQMDTAILPPHFSNPQSELSFSEDGRSLRGQNENEGQEISIDDLFPEPGAAQAESDSESQTPSERTQPQRSESRSEQKPAARFQPVNLEATANYQNLLVVDNDRQGLLEYPILWSQNAEVEGRKPKEAGFFVTSTGEVITVASDGSARFWSRPQFYPFPEEGNDSVAVADATLTVNSLNGSSVSARVDLRESATLGAKDKALQLVDDILNLNSLIRPSTKSEAPTIESSLDRLEAMNEELKASRNLKDAKLEAHQDAPRGSEYSPTLRAANASQANSSQGFKIVNGVLVAEGSEAGVLDESASSTDFGAGHSESRDSESNSRPHLNWDFAHFVLLLPERIRLANTKRRRGFSQPA